jgi:hypothetical protein
MSINLHLADIKTAGGEGAPPIDQTVAAPDNIQAGDLILVALGSRNRNRPTDLTLPDGFSVVRAEGDSHAHRPWVVWFAKTATASEPAEYTFTSNGGSDEVSSYWMLSMRVSGHDPADTFPLIVGANSGSDTVASLTIPASALEVAGSVRLSLFSSQAPFGFGSPPTIVTAGVTEIANSAGHDADVVTGWDAVEPPEASSVTAEAAGTNNRRMAGAYIVLAPAEDPSGTSVTRTRWRNDDGDEETATWREAEDTPTQAQVGETVRLRAQIQAVGDVGEVAAELRWREKETVIYDTDFSGMSNGQTLQDWNPDFVKVTGGAGENLIWDDSLQALRPSTGALVEYFWTGEGAPTSDYRVLIRAKINTLFDGGAHLTPLLRGSEDGGLKTFYGHVQATELFGDGTPRSEHNKIIENDQPVMILLNHAPTLDTWHDIETEVKGQDPVTVTHRLDDGEPQTIVDSDEDRILSGVPAIGGQGNPAENAQFRRFAVIVGRSTPFVAVQ